MSYNANKKGTYIIVYVSTLSRNKQTKRVTVKGKLTPVFEYKTQALRYITRNLNNSPYVTYLEIKKN